MRLMFLLIQSVLIVSTTFASDDYLLPENFARVRIWDSDVSNREVGHVSLETRNSYISFWPYSSDPSTTHFNLQKPDFSPVHEAPGFAVDNYQIDLSLEKKRPDRVYYIQTRSSEIDRTWNAVKNLGTQKEVGLLFDFMKWYAPGKEGIIPSSSDDSCLRFNCATMVLLALNIGGLEEKYLEEYISEQRLWEELAGSFSSVLKSENNTLETQNLGNFLEENKKLAQIVFPRHVGLVLEKKIKEELHTDLRKYIKKSYVPSLDYELFLDVVSKKLFQSNSQLYRRDFFDFISDKNIGEFYDGGFRPSANVNEEIKAIENRRFWGLMGIAGIGIGLVVSNLLKKECTIT